MEHTDKKISFLLPCALFINGAAVLMVEILGTRLLLPYFGSTIFVWSSLLIATLGGLAVGYLIGGVRNPKMSETTLFFSALSLSGFILLFLPEISGIVSRFFSPLGLKTGPLVSALIVFLPYFTVTGIISPVAVSLAAEKHGAKKASGIFYAISTVGSLIGALAAGFFLIPLLPLSAIFRITGAITAACGAYGIGFRKIAGRNIFYPLIFLAAVTSMIVMSAPYGKNNGLVIAARETFYSSKKIVSFLNYRCLFENMAIETCTDPGTNEPSPGWFSYFKEFTAGRALGSVLVIGGGGGEVFHLLPKNSDITVIELDPANADIAEKYFGVSPEMRGNYIFDDARHAFRELAARNKKFDLVVFDAFSDITLPYELASKEAFRDLSKIINPDSLVMMNAGLSMDNVPENDGFVSELAGTIRTSFPIVKAYQGKERPMRNIIYLFSEKNDSSLRLEQLALATGTSVFTDDYNPSDYMQTERNLKVLGRLRSFSEIFSARTD